ncbi:thiamine pyrophosphate-dependent enzyme, partial [Staphylococcus aureus]|uniref:thiamine pyrophosphate-dependent enzyme n=1 Tax=Staphylococcus aureus TaxID=1280 RepID=UPI00210F20F3
KCIQINFLINFSYYYYAFGKKDDVNSGGKQMPSHFSSRAKNILSQSSPVATQIPHAVGAALALKMDGKKKIATATVGEGSSNQGDFHEGIKAGKRHQTLLGATGTGKTFTMSNVIKEVGKPTLIIAH